MILTESELPPFTLVLMHSFSPRRAEGTIATQDTFHEARDVG